MRSILLSFFLALIITTPAVAESSKKTATGKSFAHRDTRKPGDKGVSIYKISIILHKPDDSINFKIIATPKNSNPITLGSGLLGGKADSMVSIFVPVTEFGKTEITLRTEVIAKSKTLVTSSFEVFFPDEISLPKVVESNIVKPLWIPVKVTRTVVENGRTDNYHGHLAYN